VFVPVILPETTIDPPFDFLRVLTWVDFSHVVNVSDAPDVLNHTFWRASRSQAMRIGCGQPLSAPTASASSPRLVTGRLGCGMPRWAGESENSSTVMRTGY
jgi:hypothetical protein